MNIQSIIPDFPCMTANGEIFFLDLLKAETNLIVYHQCIDCHIVQTEILNIDKKKAELEKNGKTVIFIVPSSIREIEKFRETACCNITILDDETEILKRYLEIESVAPYKEKDCVSGKIVSLQAELTDCGGCSKVKCDLSQKPSVFAIDKSGKINAIYRGKTMNDIPDLVNFPEE